MAQGARLECVARFLGHRSPLTTYRHYWTDPSVGLQMHLDGGAPPPAAAASSSSSAAADDGDSAALYAALRAKVDECDALRRLLVGGAAPAPAPRPPSSAAGSGGGE